MSTSFDDALTFLFAQAHAQFGNTVKGYWFYWFYESEHCPGCGRLVDKLRYKGKDTLSLNAFIYRRRGILIGYLLCAQCARAIMRAAQQQPGRQTERHAVIEDTLSRAYEAHMNSLDG